jgi:DNA-binding transcriptional regulator/RsmH inhibitor MraZ
VEPRVSAGGKPEEHSHLCANLENEFTEVMVDRAGKVEIPSFLRHGAALHCIE